MMKKQTINNIPAAHTHKSQLKHNGKNTSNTNTRYIYTEADLGEGILDVGLNTSSAVAKQKQFNPQNN